MLIFGHIGITLGAAVLLKSTLTRSYSLQPRGNNVLECLESIPRRHSAQNDPSGGRAGWLASLEKIDARLLLIGSLLPDIIDKPVGTFLFRESLSNGRIFCHTLAVLLFITLTGIYLYQSHGKIWLLVLSFGTFTHLLYDQMWLTPQTLLWPVYGWSFQRYDLTYWLQNMLYALHTDPTVYVPELVGIAILIWFVLVLVRRKRLYVFVRNGQVL